MSQITTHVLDTASGRPADGVAVTLEKSSPSGWKEIGRSRTDGDGRVKSLWRGERKLPKGLYRLVFATGFYFRHRGTVPFHPIVIITFAIRAGGHYHVPLLISPFGYTTYRGS